MRIGFISDIHGSFTALEAVLADIKKEGVDQLICLGDTVSLGPQPCEVLDALREWNAVTIMGNHDQAILDPERAEAFEITSHLIPDLEWGVKRLPTSDMAFIRSFKNTHTVRFENGIELLAFHGSPKATTDLIVATTPQDNLDDLFRGQSASVFIGGHSHIQMHRRNGKNLILNSGSVGNAFLYPFTPGNPPRLLPWAEYAILEQDGNFLRSDMRRVYFDIDKLLGLVKESGLPGTDWWFRQYAETP
ncbi:MAG: metallophosphoesterase family protein [Anaerolineales bacterium]|nr:metallophosphoesterase family protein [Anaerolineales bacterium]